MGRSSGIRWIVLVTAFSSFAVAAENEPPKAGGGAVKLDIAPGPFSEKLETLQAYKCPEWFRDAKLGIWAHWGPQAVPMAGDWYARNMYLQDNPQYKHHLENYGHPSTHGYKDIIPLWKAEKWDPDKLMEMYKKAGARYFVSMACHHDNFDLWNSKYHEWNAVKMGPKRDVVGDWQKAAKKLGLRFGVSEHMGASFTWFQPSHGADKTGDKAGVPYDGADAKYQELYHQPAAPDDTGWYSKDPRWHQEWFNRIRDLIDNYHPDLLYTDGGVPFGNEVGRSMIAHLYNSDPKRDGSKVEAVYTCKQQSKGMWIEDLERGVMAGVRPDPWQTDTSIGDWYYNKNWKYRGADWVIHMLVDIVAKNGNLLINVVQRPDGSLDPEAVQVLEGMTAWMAVNEEAIFGTRPWLVHGEGPIRAKGGHFGEDFAYSAKDVRFTTKGDKTLYAIAMGWPTEGKLVIRSLAKFPEVTAKIEDVSLLGYSGKIKWTHDADGLAVELPGQKPCEYAVSLKITGEDLRGFKPELALPPVPTIGADANGNFTLGAADAELHGDQLKLEEKNGQPNIGFWDNAQEWLSWKVKFAEAGEFKVKVSACTVHDDTPMIVEIGDQKVEVKVPRTGGWEQFVEIDAGTVKIAKAGDQIIKMRARDAESWRAVNLRWAKLSKSTP